MNSLRLTPAQRRLLKALYYFRFANAIDLTAYLPYSRPYINAQLHHLTRNSYITPYTQPNHRLLHIPTIYGLSYAGIAELRKDKIYSKPILNTYYQNDAVTLVGMKHRAGLLKLYNELSDQYPKQEVITEVQLRPTGLFPRNRFHLYIQPHENEPLIFVSDLTHVRAKRMYLHGHRLLAAINELDWLSDKYIELHFKLSNLDDAKRLYGKLVAVKDQKYLANNMKIKTNV